MALIEDDVVIWYDIDEGSGATLDNEEGTSTYDGTRSGADWATGGPTNIPDVLDFVAGDANDRLRFGGSLSDFAPTSFSLSMCFKLDSTTGIQEYFNDWDSSSGARSVLWRQNGTNMEFYVRDGGSSELQIQYAHSNTTDYLWWVLTRDGNDTTLIRNGTQVDSNTGSFSLAGGRSDLVFGGDDKDGGSPVDGQLAHAAIFNRAITAAEAAEIYNSGNGITYTSLFSGGGGGGGATTFNQAVIIA